MSSTGTGGLPDGSDDSEGAGVTSVVEVSETIGKVFGSETGDSMATARCSMISGKSTHNMSDVSNIIGIVEIAV